jgi:hypothetical protein
MNPEIQEISIEELQFVNGSGSDIDPPSTTAVLYPEVDNNPPG